MNASENPWAIDGAAEKVPSTRPTSRAATVLATLAAIAALWWGQRCLIPLPPG